MTATITELFTAEAKKTADMLPNLKQSAVLATVRLSKFQITKQDKEATRQVATTNGNDEHRAKVVKELLDPKRMMAINELDTGIRTYHYEHTTGWGEGQARMLGNRALTEYAAFMSAKKDERQRLVEAFVAGYQQYIIEDTAGLGALAKSSDYIDPARVADKFGMAVEYLPVPDSRHFEVLGIENHIDAIKAQLEENTRTALAGVQREIGERIRTVITALVEKIAVLDNRQEGERRKVHPTIVSNIASLADLIPALNVAGDAELDTFADEMRRRLCGWDAEAIRDSAVVRKDLATEANDMLAKLESIMPEFGD